MLRPAAGEDAHGFPGQLAEGNGHLGKSAFAPVIGLPPGFGSGGCVAISMPRASPGRRTTRRDAAVLSAVPHLPIVLRAEPGEDVRGFLRRLAAANGHRSIWTFSQALGLTASFGPASAGCQWDRLAEAAGLSDAEVAAMRWPTAEPRSVKTPMVAAGAPTVRGFVHPQLVRLCPYCLREDGILRCFWLFWCAVACPRHGTLLSTACRCGRHLLPGSYGRTWECSCGAATRDLAASAAPTSAVEVARNLAARVGPASGYSCENSLPTPFDALCAHDYMILLHTLGLVAATPAHEDVPVPKGRRANEDGLSAAVPALDTTLARLEVATAALHDWPGAYLSLLERVEAQKADAGAKAADIFATPVGRLLVRPMRGADGLPLRILCQAFSCYLRQRRIRRVFWPGRRLSSDAEARRIHKLFNATTLARQLGTPSATPLNRRVLRQVIAGLDEQERALEAEDLALVVRERATALHRAASTAMSSKAARKAVEGCDASKKGKALYGWEHPRLLPADPILSGLCRFGASAYASKAVEAMLARLRSVARPVERLDGLLPLRSSAFGGMLKPWFTKTSLLLDVVEGRLPAYATAEAPRLADLHVAADDVRRARSPYSPVWEGKHPNYTRVDRVVHGPFDRQAGEAEFASYRRVNTELRARFGLAGPLTLPELRRLTRAALVRWRVEARSRPRGGRPKDGNFYHVGDVVGFVQRRLDPKGLSGADAAAFGRVADIGPLLSALKEAGAAPFRVEREFAARGVRTEVGAAWRNSYIARATERAEKGERVVGVLTGFAYVNGFAPLCPLPVEKAPRGDADTSPPPQNSPFPRLPTHRQHRLSLHGRVPTNSRRTTSPV